MVLYGLRFVIGILFDQTFETFSFFCEIIYIYITKFVSESFFIFTVSPLSQIDIRNIRVADPHHINSDPDPDPHQSDGNLRPLV